MLELIVVDSSSLILLAKLEWLGKLAGQYERVLIPAAVFEEVVGTGKNKKTFFDALLVEKRVQEGALVVKTVKSPEATEELMETFGLGLGESETLALALESKAGVVALDDGKAMKAARVLGLPFITTLTFVLQLLFSGNIRAPEATQTVNKLAAWGWYSGELIERTLLEVKRHE